MSEFDFSQTQRVSQTQEQTQSTQTSLDFPENLWGILVSASGTPTEADLAREAAAQGTGGEVYVDRPQRVEMVKGKKDEIKIGRHPKADLVLNGKKVSTWHARIFLDPDGDVKLEDLSTNGTYVRSKKVGKGNVTLLQTGDDIVFGPASSDFLNDFRYIFQGRPSSSSQDFSGRGGGIHEFYDVREVIGKGSFATVRKGIQRSTGKMMAIKIIMKARFAANPKTMEMIEREVQIMKNLDHKYCVRYVDYYEDDERMWLVIEYVDGGDLLDYVMKRGGLKENETREIALMICEAVAYLHSKGVAHRDLKPENLLLTKGSRPLCKVTDFGLAKMADNNTMLRTLCGTPTYLAPEVILNENPGAGYGNQVDAWSIGVILYSCLTNQTPFDESESTPLPQRMRERKINFETVRQAGMSELVVDFLQNLLITDPKKRMAVKDALHHPWLATVLTSDGSSTPALPLLVSSLPYNAGAAFASNTNGTSNASPSTTTAAMSLSGEESYSQRLDNLRLNTPGRSFSMASMTHTTPDRAENGDLSTSTEVPTPIVNDFAFATNREDQDVEMAPTSPTHGNGGSESVLMESTHQNLKRKEPNSAFSSNSSINTTAKKSTSDSLPPPPLPTPAATNRNNHKKKDETPPPAEEDAIEEMSAPSRRRSVATHRPTPTSNKRAGRGRASSSAMSVSPAPASQDSSPLDSMTGPITRKRAKLARMS